MLALAVRTQSPNPNWHYMNDDIEVVKEKKKIEIAASPSQMVIMFTIFAIK